MIGHECTLPRTNAGGVVWVCECGEYGTVVPMVAWETAKGARGRRRLEIAESEARARHATHVNAVRSDIARRTDEALASHGRLIEKANATLQRRGRYGHP